VDGCGHANAQVHGPSFESYYIELYGATKVYDSYYNPHGSGAYTTTFTVGSDIVAAYGALYNFQTGNLIDEGVTGYHSAQ